MWKDDACLLDMLNGARKLVALCAGLSRDEWDGSPELQDACFWNICVVGEAATRVSDERRSTLPDIPWSTIIGARNVLIHGYDRINPDKVWGIITVSAPELVEALTPVVPSPPDPA